MLLNKLLEELPAEIDGEELEIHKISPWCKQPTWWVIYASDCALLEPKYEIRDNDLLMALLRMKRLIGDTK